MKTWLVVLTLILSAQTVRSQNAPSIPVQITWIAPEVREYLAKRWTDSLGQVERAYCVRFGSYYNPYAINSTERRVTDIWEAQVSGATYNSITSIKCLQQPDITVLHVHPPQSYLMDGTLIQGGMEAYECTPSGVDYQSMLSGGFEFWLIQCDRNAITPFYRTPYAIVQPVVAPDTVRASSKPKGGFWALLRKKVRRGP
jgi:hypothetical protein